MKIEILCTDGSPLGVVPDTIWGDSFRVGVGGAELALLTLCQEWTKAGHEVVLYNDPKGINREFEQRPCHAFLTKGKRDVLIVFRSPNIKAIAASGLKVWWSCDQYTRDDFANFSLHMDKIVVISPFHKTYFRDKYNINAVTVIDIPVRVDDYDVTVQRVPNKLLFTSVPDRGLNNLWRQWQAIKLRVPESTLTITSDYRLWGMTNPMNETYRDKWMLRKDYDFIGAVPRDRLVEEQLSSDILLYPSNYEELFCIAVAEAQYAGAYPITSATGALQTTNMGTKFEVDANDPRNDITFVNAVVDLLSDRDRLERMRKEVQQKAKERFHPDNILKQWEEVFECQK